MPIPNQDILNIIFKERTEIVRQEWNTRFLTHMDLETRQLEWHSMRQHLTRSLRILHFADAIQKPWKPVEMRCFEHPHLLAKFGPDVLLYRSTANRLLAKALGEAPT